MLELDKFRLQQLSVNRSKRGTNNLINCLLQLPQPVTLEHTQEYILELLNCQKFAHSHKTVSAIRAYGKWAQIDWMRQFPYPRLRYEPVRDYLSTDECRRFLECAPKYKPAHAHLKPLWRSYSVFWSIHYMTGMRLEEVANLTKSSILLGSKVIVVTNTKTGKNRRISLSKTLENILIQYLKSVEGERLFKISAMGWQVNFNRRLQLCGIEKRPGLIPRAGRRYFITESLRSGSNLIDVQRIVGHTSADTTGKYYIPSDEQLRKVAERLPIARVDTPPEEYFKELGEASNEIVKDLNPVSSGFKITEDKDGNLVYEYRVVVKKKKYKHP